MYYKYIQILFTCISYVVYNTDKSRELRTIQNLLSGLGGEGGAHFSILFHNVKIQKGCYRRYLIVSPEPK